jgi:hypothetical protein
MGPSRRNGVGKGEVLAFLALAGMGVAICLYLNQKPQVIERTVVIEKEAPPPAPQPPPPKPAPAVKPPALVIRTPVEPLQLPEVVVAANPPVPPCVAMMKKLRIALEAAIQTEKDLARAKQAAIDNLHQSPDYQAMKADLEAKKKAKDDALNALRQDNVAGNDTDQDTANVRAASLAWATQVGVLTKMEEATVAADQTVNRKIQDLKEMNVEIADQHRQLEQYIYREIVSVSDRTLCQINDVQLDTNKWNLQVDMFPVNQEKPGAMADAALNNIGTVLETLSRSPFPWNAIQFRVFGEETNAVEYQISYSHSDIADVNFGRLHMSSLRYSPLHAGNLRIGASGILIDARIINVVDDNNMIVWLDESDNNIDDIVRPVWIRGIDTTGKVDESCCDIPIPLVVTKTVRYLTVGGSYKTIFLLEPRGFNQNVLFGDYYDNNKLVAMAQDVWLNSAIDHLQGRTTLPDFYVRRPGTKPPELVNTLQIGGYARGDGSTCPLTLVHTPHLVMAAQPDPPTNRMPPLPSPYQNTNPLIANSPPPPPPGF